MYAQYLETCLEICFKKINQILIIATKSPVIFNRAFCTVSPSKKYLECLLSVVHIGNRGIFSTFFVKTHYVCVF